MANKKEAACLLLMLLLIMGVSFSCSEKKLSYEEQFNLKRFKMKHFDLYNPILNTFKLDPVSRKEHPEYYYFDSYFDDKNVVRYSFLRSESYGFLHEFKYNKSGQIQKVIIYPILVDTIDKGGEICVNQYYYIDGKLKAYRDELNGNVILIDGDSALIYEGILSSATDSFNIKKIDPKEYFIPAY